MTEPNDEPVGPSSPTDQMPTQPSAPQPTTPAEPEPAATGPIDPVAPPASAWVTPESGGRSGRRGCCLIVAVLGALGAILAVVAIVALIFLGAQVRDLQGTVRFEAGTETSCFVKEPATTFPASSTIHFAATFKRLVTADENISVVVTFPDGTSKTTDSAYQGGGVCVSDTLTPGLDAGQWALEFRSGTEVLATGSFVITP